jgi:hypothetical protein
VALGHEEADMCMDPPPGASRIRALEVDGQRGYGHPDIHFPKQDCQRRALRRPAGALIAADVEVGAVRISATGWEGHVLEGLQVRDRSGVEEKDLLSLCALRDREFFPPK